MYDVLQTKNWTRTRCVIYFKREVSSAAPCSPVRRDTATARDQHEFVCVTLKDRRLTIPFSFVPLAYPTRSTYPRTVSYGSLTTGRGGASLTEERAPPSSFCLSSRGGEWTQRKNFLPAHKYLDGSCCVVLPPFFSSLLLPLGGCSLLDHVVQQVHLFYKSGRGDHTVAVHFSLFC